MGRTIGRHWPSSAPRGDYVVLCDYCGVRYRRSQLVRKGNGRLACSGPGTLDDADGRDEVELSEMTGRGTARYPGTPQDGGNYGNV